MSSVSAVPETELMSGEQLSADDAWHTVRRYGLGHLLSAGFLRFRYGDGLQPRPGVRPAARAGDRAAVIAGAGLAAALGVESFAEVVARTVVALSPGSSDALLRDAVDGGTDEGSERGEVVVVLGLATAFLAATSAFAQLERGANRIYGTERDRPALRKYTRAAVLTATAGTALAVGLLLIVAGEPFGDAVEQVYHWGGAAETAFDVVRWPVGLAALVVAVTLLFRHAPRRSHPACPGWRSGRTVTVLAWLAVSGLLGLDVVAAGNFDETYSRSRR